MLFIKHTISKMSAARAITGIIGFGIIGLAILVTLVAKPGVAELGVQCSSVVSQLAPCLNYIIDKQNQPPPNCCSGMRIVDGQARTKPDRQAACRCIRNVLINYKYDSGRLVQLPKKCGLSIYIPPDLDCSKVSG